MSSNTRAIIYLQLCLLSFIVGDASAKKLLENLPFMQVITLRTGVSVLVMGIIILLSGRIADLRVSKPIHHIARGFFFMAISIGYYVAIKFFPMNAVSAAQAAAPLIIAALSPLVLRESATPLQWFATATGFAGVFLVLKPDLAVMNWQYLALFSLPISYGAMILWSRYLSRTESDWALNFYMYFPLLICPLLVPTEAWEALTSTDWLVMIVSGTGCTLGFIFFIAAFRVGKAVLIAPFEYTGILMALSFDILMWQFVPGNRVWLGVLLILVCAAIMLWVAHRQERTHRAQTALREN